MPKRPLLIFVALVCALAVAVPLVSGTGDPDQGDSAQLSGNGRGNDHAADGDRREDSSKRPGQTSEGVRGELVEPLPPGRALRTRISNREGWTVAPGVHYRRWDQTDRRGRIRAHLLTVTPRKPGVSIDYASQDFVPQRNSLTGLLHRDKAVAGINGGFFDIHDTGAPLGVGVDRQRGMLHASRYTWNNAFYMDDDGIPHIGKLELTAQILQYPQMEITNVNSPRVRVASIGIYAPDWGWTSGYRVTDGQTDAIRMVVIKNGKVLANKTSLNAGKRIDGVVLIGRGPGAAQLRQMRVGSTANVDWGLANQPPFAISGEKILLRNRQLQVSNDRELHPRTAIGIDHDTGRILMLVVDGRSSRSRGYTLVEEARLMRKLGAEVALNFDGGGSTTMAGEGRGGKLKVLNAPSDGSQRHIADAVGVHYRRPAG